LALAARSADKRDGVKAEEYVIDVVRDEPANVDAVLLYTRALILQRRFEAARIMCQRAISAAPADARGPELLGEIELKGGRLALALLEFEKSMLLDPYSADAVEGLTAVYQAGGATQPLLRKLEKLALSGTPSSRLMEITGRLYASKGMYKDAERCLKAAVEMDPHRASAALALAETDIQQNASSKVDAPSARADASRWASLVTGENRSLIAALDADQRHDSAASIREYETAVQSGDPSGIASNNLAWIYAVQGKNLDRAMQLAQHALELNPGSPAVLDTIGVIQVRKHEYTQAIASFQSGAQRATELEGSQQLRSTIEQHLAYAHQLAGQPPTQQQASN
jgi:tetratricopeptide (TPR) repeat protein